MDDLLGYQPQLSTEQIRKYYHDLAADFAELPFEQVMDKCLVLVKKYYSCYSFLLQISVLWLNHFSLAQSPERQSEVLEQAAELCLRIPVSYTHLDVYKRQDYTKKGGVIASEIMRPPHAPEIYLDRATLWNAVELSLIHISWSGACCWSK